jgi:thiamine-monophosphate kinase
VQLSVRLESWFRTGTQFRYDVFALPLSERALISAIAKAASAPRQRQNLSRKKGKASLVAGIGDDCAVLRLNANRDLLVTTDFSLEGVHFRRDWHPASAVGHKCLARGLSDIAATGGEPLAVFLSLALPEKLEQVWVDGFLKGLLKLAKAFRVSLAGGDTAQSLSGVLADVTVIGSVPEGKAVLRSGAQPGDRIYVTGALGGAAAALKMLLSKQKVDPRKFARHFYPEPRVAIGKFLREKSIPSSMIDISDGLSTDLSHICEESGVGAEIWSDKIPRAEMGVGPVDVNLALHGGEEYELLFTASRLTKVPSRIAGVTVTCIGEIERIRSIFISDENGSRSLLRAGGWEHFRKTSAK